MGFSLNKWEGIGNLGNDAETRFTTNNVSVTTFSIATVHSFKKDNEWQNKTTWHNCTAFNLPDFLKDCLKKGKKVYIDGRLEIEEYTDKENIKRKSPKIIVSQIIPLEKTEHGETSQGNPEQDSGWNDLP